LASLDFLPYKPCALHAVASATLKALAPSSLFSLSPKIEDPCNKLQGIFDRNCTFERPISTLVGFELPENRLSDRRLDFRKRLPQILPGMRLLFKFVPNSDQF